jgi:hypothetical protein
VTNPTDHYPSLEAYSLSGNEVTSHILWSQRVIAYSQDPATGCYSELKDAVCTSPLFLYCPINASVLT